MQQTRTDRSQEGCLWVSGVSSPPPASAAADAEPGAVIVDDAFALAVVVAGASAPEAAVGEVAAVDVDDAVEETDAVAAVSPVPTSADDAVAGDSVAAAAVVVVAVEIVAGTPRGLLGLGPHLDAAAWRQVVVAAVAAAVVSGVSHHDSVPHHLQQ